MEKDELIISVARDIFVAIGPIAFEKISPEASDQGIEEYFKWVSKAFSTLVAAIAESYSKLPSE